MLRRAHRPSKTEALASVIRSDPPNSEKKKKKRGGRERQEKKKDPARRLVNRDGSDHLHNRLHLRAHEAKPLRLWVLGWLGEVRAGVRRRGGFRVDPT